MRRPPADPADTHTFALVPGPGDTDNNLVLVGGAGHDILIGGAGDDLLIGESTSFDLDPTGLGFLRQEWSATATPYADRIAHLTGAAGGSNNGRFLTAATVFDDGVKDVLAGGRGADGFLVSALDTLDLKAGEQKVTV